MDLNKIIEENVKLKQENKILKDGQGSGSQDGELWLDEVLDIESPEFGSNNLILAPVGSGKTYTIHNRFAKNGGEYQLMLVSTRYLKEAVAPGGVNIDKRIEDGLGVFTTTDNRYYGGRGYKMHIMTYHEFGSRIRNDDKFIEDNNIRSIYCDEVHSLVEYKSFGSNETLVHAMKYLFKRNEGVNIYYFTATTEYLDILESIDPYKFNYIRVYDYLNYPNIKRYINLSTHYVTHLEHIRDHLQAHSTDFIDYGYKGLAFQSTITGQKKLAEMLEEEGFTPLVLWSQNTGSEHGDMDEEQLRALNEMINTEKIPAPYNFLVINGAMREGWDLRDDKVELVIVNTISETYQIQARGRVRKNIANLILRTSDREVVVNKLNVSKEYLNTPLTPEDKDRLCEELGLVNSNNCLLKWRSVSKIIRDNGYIINNKRARVSGKQVSVSIISK